MNTPTQLPPLSLLFMLGTKLVKQSSLLLHLALVHVK